MKGESSIRRSAHLKTLAAVSLPAPASGALSVRADFEARTDDRSPSDSASRVEIAREVEGDPTSTALEIDGSTRSTAAPRRPRPSDDLVLFLV